MRVLDGQTGKIYKSKDIHFVDHLIDLKAKNSTNHWVVIDEVVKAFRDRYPKEWKSYLVRVEEIRETRENPKYADNKKEGLRYLVDYPEWIGNVVRGLYSPDELSMDKKFMVEFAKRYPIFKVPEHL